MGYKYQQVAPTLSGGSAKPLCVGSIPTRASIISIILRCARRFQICVSGAILSERLTPSKQLWVRCERPAAKLEHHLPVSVMHVPFDMLKSRSAGMPKIPPKQPGDASTLMTAPTLLAMSFA